MNRRARLWVRAGCVGRLQPYGEVTEGSTQSNTVLLVPRFVGLFIGAVLNCTVLKCSCHILLWGICAGVLSRFSEQQVSGCLRGVSVQDDIVRQ